MIKKTIEKPHLIPIPIKTHIIANRTLINDYGTSNPYPTCDAVNIVRNSNELERFLKDLGK